MDGDRCSRMRGPLAPHAEGFRRWLVSSGFAPASVQHRLTLFSQFSGWLAAEGIAPGEVTAAVAERFAAAMRSRRDVGAVPPGAPAHAGALLDASRGYLAAERGLAATTIRSYLGVARRF